MSLLSWLTKKPSSDVRAVERENQDLKAELSMSVMRFERRRSEVMQIADDVMKAMHNKGGGN